MRGRRILSVDATRKRFRVYSATRFGDTEAVGASDINGPGNRWRTSIGCERLGGQLLMESGPDWHVQGCRGQPSPTLLEEAPSQPCQGMGTRSCGQICSQTLSSPRNTWHARENERWARTEELDR